MGDVPLLHVIIVAAASTNLCLAGLGFMFAERSFASRLAVIGKWSRSAHVIIGIAMVALGIAVAGANLLLWL